jgi:hypothetical protein
MSEEHDKADEKSFGWRTAFWVALAIVILYPLSVGPISFLSGAGLLSDPAVAAIRPVYFPLLLVGHVAPPLERLLMQYDRASHQLGSRWHK